MTKELFELMNSNGKSRTAHEIAEDIASNMLHQDETKIDYEDEVKRIEATLSKPTRRSILAAAEKCVCGDREQDYGSPEDNFRTIADLWEIYLRRKCVSPDAEVIVYPEDVAAMMALMKIARIVNGSAKADNWVDLAGYAACGGELEGE